MVNLTWKARRLVGTAMDIVHGIDTTLGLSDAMHGTPDATRQHGTAHDPLPWSMMPRIMKLLPIPPNDSTFVDFGCGKGRALLAAARYPFARIIGVEYSPALSAVAERNIRDARLILKRCQDISIIQGDAVEFDPMPGRTVYLFNNPFAYNVTKRVLRNVLLRHRERGMAAYFVFSSIDYADLLCQRSDIRLLHKIVMRCDFFHSKSVYVFETA